MSVVIAGASGFLGGALCDHYLRTGQRVVRLVRRTPQHPDELRWDPSSQALDLAPVGKIDAVVNLAGENVGAGRWTTARRERILRSRVDATRTLVAAIGHLAEKPAVFLSASATGFYGDRGDDELTEESPIGHGFLPEVCLAWETHADGARRVGVRTAFLRFGMVIGRGGALGRMLPLFRLGLGGRLGSGRQWMSWIAIRDVISALERARVDSRAHGAINVVAPDPVTNVEFTRALGSVLRRPTAIPAPAFALRAMFGAMADELLLASARVRPEKLRALGYHYTQPSLSAALAEAIGS
jgi:uncharacterized protein (TIGR01777 family)